MDLLPKNFLKLNSFCGSGDFRNAEIVFFGNEEGLDRDDIQDVLKQRFNEVNTNVKIVSDYLEGHYRIDWKTDDKAGKSQMINYQCRIINFLQEEGINDDWFLPKGKNLKIDKKIEEYRVKHLYREKIPGQIITALTELRPLPRKNESVWNYFKSIKKSQYFKAYGFSTVRGLHQEYSDFRNHRLKVLKNLFNHSKKCKFIIGIGDQKAKLKFFKKVDPDIVFEPVPDCNNKLLQANTKFNGKLVNIYLLKFFGNGHMSLSDLKSVALILKKHFS
jgi:hypothetical protein